jgi:heterodisulfide reductase subunit B
MGVELRELPDWTCCGASSAHVQDDELAFSLAARNLLIADKAGTDLVVPCAACFLRLKTAERDLKGGRHADGLPQNYTGNFSIKHSADFLWEQTGEKALKAKVKRPLQGLNVVCYYGCLTTRPAKVTGAARPEDPQALDELMKGVGASVASWSYKTDCCGGSLVLTHPPVARRLIKKLLDMAEEAGAEAIVTGCPMCQSNLDARQMELAGEGGKRYHVPVFFFTELMGLAFGEASAGKWLKRHITDAQELLGRKGLS